jgi:hypothetical protein
VDEGEKVTKRNNSRVDWSKPVQEVEPPNRAELEYESNPRAYGPQSSWGLTAELAERGVVGSASWRQRFRRFSLRHRRGAGGYTEALISKLTAVLHVAS